MSSMFRTAVLALGLVYLLPAMGEERLPTIHPEQYTEEQKKAAEEFQAARRLPVFGPFEPLMYSPQFMNQARAMGDYLRYHASIGPGLTEFAILVVARQWSQDYEWYVHYPLALKSGLTAQQAAAIAAGRVPEGMNEAQAVVYEFLGELKRTHQVSDANFARAQKQLGKKGVVDLTGLAGYYSLLAMELNVARYPLPRDGVPLPALPQRAGPAAPAQ